MRVRRTKERRNAMEEQRKDKEEKRNDRGREYRGKDREGDRSDEVSSRWSKKERQSLAGETGWLGSVTSSPPLGLVAVLRD